MNGSRYSIIFFQYVSYVNCICYFSPGNYTCSCNIGYELFTSNGTAGFSIEFSETGERDGDIFQRNKSCVPVMCPKLHSPDNGILLTTKVCFN